MCAVSGMLYAIPISIIANDLAILGQIDLLPT